MVKKSLNTHSALPLQKKWMLEYFSHSFFYYSLCSKLPYKYFQILHFTTRSLFIRLTLSLTLPLILSAFLSFFSCRTHRLTCVARWLHVCLYNKMWFLSSFLDQVRLSIYYSFKKYTNILAAGLLFIQSIIT